MGCRTEQRTPTPFGGWPGGWEVEVGGRYFAGLSQFRKDFGPLADQGLPLISDISRLTYDDMRIDAGELLARIETPWNLFAKGYIGRGLIGRGHMNDEDFVIVVNPLVGAYQNTLSPKVDGRTRYTVIDAGFDVLRGGGYKFGAFLGYFRLDQTINAYGCTPVAFVNCLPLISNSGSAVVIENNTWRGVRIGAAGEAMLTEKVKLSGEIAYLPNVKLDNTDLHFYSNTGELAEIFRASGAGRGVQLEALLSYYLTPGWSVGIGGRYWGMWTRPDALFTCTLGCDGAPTPPQYFRAQTEQIGAFVQTSYRFDWANPISVRN